MDLTEIPDIEKYLKARESSIFSLLKTIAKIPAQTYRESKKALFIQKHLTDLGVKSVIDAKGNVWGKLLGIRKGRRILTVAHIDTVHTCTGKIKETRKYLYGHGVCDNSAGVTALLMTIAYIKKYSLSFSSDFYFAFTVQEEGLGAKGGMKYLLTHLPKTSAVINMESHNIGRLTHRSIGQCRCKLTVTSPSGGHAFREFGNPNAIMGAALFLSQWYQIQGFIRKDTTYNIGSINGGGSINSIAKECEFTMEVRSINEKRLKKLKQSLTRIVKETEKNSGVSIKMETLAQTTSASMPTTHPLCIIATEAQKKLGIITSFDMGNTDGDVSLAQHIPTITLGSTNGYKTHSMEEYMEKAPFLLGIQQNYLILMEILKNY